MKRVLLVVATALGCAAHSPPASDFRKLAKIAVEACPPEEAAKCLAQGRALLPAKGRAQESFELVAAACAGDSWEACELAKEHYKPPRREGATANHCMLDWTFISEVRCLVRRDGEVSGCKVANAFRKPDDSIVQDVVKVTEASHFEPATWGGVAIESVYRDWLCPP